MHLCNQIAQFDAKKLRLRSVHALIASAWAAELQANAVDDVEKAGEEGGLVGARHVQQSVATVQNHLQIHTVHTYQISRVLRALCCCIALYLRHSHNAAPFHQRAEHFQHHLQRDVPVALHKTARTDRVRKELRAFASFRRRRAPLLRAGLALFGFGTFVAVRRRIRRGKTLQKFGKTREGSRLAPRPLNSPKRR